MRLIDADKLLEEVNKEYEEARAEFLKDGDKNPYMSGKADGLGKAHFLITGQPTINDWIPVSKKLPDKPEPNEEIEGKALELYLVSIKGCKYPVRLFWNGEYFADRWSIIENVTAWQPLPEPYEGV